MDEVLRRIKRAVRAGNLVLTVKAKAELDLSPLDESDLEESVLQASRIEKPIRSTSALRKNRREYLHIIKSPNFDGVLIYTKGKLESVMGVDTYYVLVSAKEAD